MVRYTMCSVQRLRGRHTPPNRRGLDAIAFSKGRMMKEDGKNRRMKKKEALPAGSVPQAGKNGSLSAEPLGELKDASAKDRIRLFVTLGTTGILCAGQMVVSSLVIRYAGSVIGTVGGKLAPGEEIVGTLAAIFGQLRDAVLSQPWAVPLILWAVTFALGYLPAKLRFPTWAKWVCGVLAGVLLLAGPFACLFFTAVNGVRFGDIVISLARLAAGGGFALL